MNRWDEIKAAALDAAQHVTQDPAKRNAMADDLITLIGLMVDAVGKGVAVAGEADLNQVLGWNRPDEQTPEEAAEFEAEQREESVSAHTRYLTGEALQRQADYVATEARSADLDRYATPAWRPRCTECGGRECLQLSCTKRCPECNRTLRFGHMFNCSQRPPTTLTASAVAHCSECNRAEGDGHARGCRLAGCVAVHVAHDLDLNVRGNCAGCGATPDGPACDWSTDCPVHGVGGSFGC